MMKMPTMDFETYSEAGYLFDWDRGCFIPLMKGKPGIMAVSSAVYAEHPSTRVISMAYDLRDGVGVRLWTPGTPEPTALFNHIRAGGLVEAHNSAFEYYVWFFVCRNRMGWPDLPLGQMRCSASKARGWGLPGKLELLSDKKDPRGKQLIRLLSVPRKPTESDQDLYRTFEKYPDLHYEMYDYNHKDVIAEIEVSERVPDLNPVELEVWKLDQEINSRGVAVDTRGLYDCISMFHQASDKYTRELRNITGGAVNTVDEISKGSAGDKWLQTRGFSFDSLDKETVETALQNPDNYQPDVYRALQIRELIGGASVKKLFALQRHLNSDSRIRDLFMYCGAERTGRWAGRGPQPQNLKNSGPEIDGREWGNTSAEIALHDISTGDLEAVESKWGNAVDLIGSCMRSLFVAGPWRDLICSDYSAIEAVVLAALAGEEWRLEVFRTHGKIYEASASKITGVPLDEILNHKATTGKHHPLRKSIGKVAELASGYAGWIGAWKAFGAGDFMADEEIKQNILRWRSESPAIVEMWGGQWRKTPGVWEFTPEFYGVEGMAVLAVMNPGNQYRYRDITFEVSGDVLYIGLPSGRYLSYHNPRLNRDVDPRGLDVWQLSFMGMDKGWSRIPTYGGKLTENITQAVARDIMAAALLRVNRAGYPPVLHVHDEIVSEVPEGFGSIEEFETLMKVREPWFADWPIRAAGGWRGKRYRK